MDLAEPQMEEQVGLAEPQVDLAEPQMEEEVDLAEPQVDLAEPQVEVEPTTPPSNNKWSEF